MKDYLTTNVGSVALQTPLMLASGYITERPLFSEGEAVWLRGYGHSVSEEEGAARAGAGTGSSLCS